MNRPLGILTLALPTLLVWLVSTSACSGGGSDAPVSRGDADAPPGEGSDAGPTVSPDATPPAPDGTPSPSPFDPAAPVAPDGTLTGSDATPGSDTSTGTDADALTAEPSTSDDGPELRRPIGDGTDTAAIVGLWDYSRTTDTGTDIVLFAIDAAGGVTEYDFQNDATGSGADCHVVRRSSIASRGDDRYDIQDSSTLPGAASGDDVLITADDTTITFRYLGTASDPQLGGTAMGVEESYPAATPQDATELAVCES